MKKLLPLLLVLFVTQPALADNHGGKHKKQAAQIAMMQHGNPAMPNLMQIVVKHSDALNLNEEQAAAMKVWRETNGPKTNAMLKELMQLEAEALQASLAGESSRTLKGMFKKTLKLRKNIAYGKIACRENLRKQLGEEKLQQVLVLYSEMLAVKAAQ